MTQTPNIVIHFKDLETDEHVRESIERHCHRLAEEFHEVAKLEVSLSEEGTGFTAHGHVTGKNLDVMTHAAATALGPAADQMFDKVERHLRRVHDKRIFSRRRDARKDPAKRKIDTE